MPSATHRLHAGRTALLICPLALLALPSPSNGRTWHILNEGSGDAPTIQAGIDSAAVGDTVLVGPGTYLENLSVVGKDLVLKSEMGPEATILDGSSQQEAVFYLSGQTRATVVEGFTITGGTGHLRGPILLGGGMYLESGSSPVIRGNVIIGNGVSGITRGGGGLFTNTLLAPPISAIVEGNVFQSNTAALGGAITVGPGGTEIRNNIFRSNACSLDGGAIYAGINSGSLTINGNQFWENYAGDHGGGVYASGDPIAQVSIAWNLFVGNQADGLGTGDTGAGGAVHVSDVRGSILNNTIVEGIGPSGPTRCGGGGISLEYTSADLNIADNIIALNSNCGIACRNPIENTLGRNLFWMNQDGDLGSGLGECPSAWASNQIFADPMFCGAEVGNYTVSIESPALTGPVPMGVWTTPGCGPGVPVQPTSWGRIKAMYRSGP